MYIQNLITMNNTDIKIYGKFVNELVDNKLADAKQIYDEDYILIHPEDGESVAAGNFQNRINKDFKESITDIQSTIGDPEKDITCRSITVTTPNDADGNATGISIYPDDNTKGIIVGENVAGNEYQCTHAGVHWDTNDGGIHVWPNKKINNGIATLMVGSNAENQSKHSAGMASNDTLSRIWADQIKVDTISTDNGHINISDIATHGYVDDKIATKITDSYTKAEIDSKLDNVKSSNDIVATIKATRYRPLDPTTMKSGDPVIEITDADGLYDKMVLGSKVAINYSDLIDNANSNSDLVLYIGKKNVILEDQQQTSSATTYTASFDDGNKKYILTVNSTGSNTLVIK